MTNELTFQPLIIEGDFFDLKGNAGNNMYGFQTYNKEGVATSYVVVGASFKGAQFVKEKTRWKRSKSGQVSAAFYEWEEVARKELYEQFFKPRPYLQTKGAK